MSSTIVLLYVHSLENCCDGGLLLLLLKGGKENVDDPAATRKLSVRRHQSIALHTYKVKLPQASRFLLLSTVYLYAYEYIRIHASMRELHSKGTVRLRKPRIYAYYIITRPFRSRVTLFSSYNKHQCTCLCILNSGFALPLIFFYLVFFYRKIFINDSSQDSVPYLLDIVLFGVLEQNKYMQLHFLAVLRERHSKFIQGYWMNSL